MEIDKIRETQLTKIEKVVNINDELLISGVDEKLQKIEQTVSIPKLPVALFFNSDNQNYYAVHIPNVENNWEFIQIIIKV